MPRPQRILWALTSHGLGHLTRSLALASALRERQPGLEYVVATTIPRERVARDLAPPFEHRAVAYEPGTLQRSCFELDVTATREAYRRFLEGRAQRLRDEERFLRDAGCCAVVSDIPALPVRAAANLGMTAIGVANFTWDWILEPILSGSAAEAALDVLREDYACGSVQLRLPFGPDTSPFPRCEVAPLVSRRASLAPAELRRRLGIPQEDERRLVLVCPGGWQPDAWPDIHLRDGAGLRFLTVGGLPITADAPLRALDHELPCGVSFPDLVACADVVVAKPGYGIASECAAHHTPLVVIERPEFRETPLLLEQFRALGPCAELSLADFFAGDWRAAIQRALAGEHGWAPECVEDTPALARRLEQLL